MTPPDRSILRSAWFIGADLGKLSDHTALAALELCNWIHPRTFDPATLQPLTSLSLDLRTLERLPLGTPYPVVCQSIAALCDRIISRTAQERPFGTPRPCLSLVVDASGVGEAVIDSLPRIPGKLIAVTITAGQNARRVKDPQGAARERWSVPKPDLVAAVQTAMSNGTLRIAKGLPAAAELSRELLNMRAEISERNISFEGKGSDHDDMVLAAALATWYALRPSASAGFRSAPLPVW